MSEARVPEVNVEVRHPAPCTILLAVQSSNEALKTSLVSLSDHSRLQQSALYVVGTSNESSLSEIAADHWESLRLRFGEIIVVQSINDLEPIDDADLLLVSAGVELPQGWDCRIWKGAATDSRIGAVAAIDDASAPFQASSDVALQPDAWDAALFCLGDRAVYDTPRFSSACLFLRRAALDQAGSRLDQSCGELIAEFESLQPKLSYLGWRTSVIDFCAVSTHGVPLRTSHTPEAEALSVFGELHPLRSLASAAEAFVRNAPAKVELPGLDERPVVLHLLHSWGGGIRKWVEEFSAADTSRIHLMLVTVQVGDQGTQRIRLSAVNCPDQNLRHWDLTMPIRSIAPGSLEYERILQDILRDYCVDAIMVSSLIGHALSALEQNVKTLVVCHDYLPLCQSIFPYFERECPSCTVVELGRCRSDNPLNSEFRQVAAADWDALRNRYVEILLERRPILVAPSRSVVDGLCRLDGRLRTLSFHLVPHGLRPGLLPLTQPLRSDGEPLRVVVLGRVNLLKGERLLRELLAAHDDRLEITLVGCGPKGEALAAEFGVKAVAEYQPGNLGDVLSKIAPHAGLLLSSFPETYSYTLSELTALGIPPMATRLGAFAERIRDGDSGLLFEPRIEALQQLLDRVLRDPAILTAIAKALRATDAPRSTDDMVRDYSAWLPTSPLPFARFPVGVGRRTALHSEYVHLSDAYSHLRDGYAELNAAYQQATSAYESTLKAYEASSELATSRGEEIAQLRQRAAQFFADVQPLGLKKRWWRAPRALRLVEAYRDELEGPRAAPKELKPDTTPKV